jgi:hypothetical protein
MEKPIVKANIKKESLDLLLAQVTNNPVAEVEIPRLLAKIIDTGGIVTVRDDDAGRTYRLGIESGKFILKD